MSALAFNVCLLLLPLAAAVAFILVTRDHLYAYEYSTAGARAVSSRVERLNGQLIQLDFDRQRQWDDLVALELMGGDVDAARGFLLSVRGMAGAREVNQLNRRVSPSASDAELELAALDLLTPGTRSRYEATVPLLSRRAASGAAEARIERVYLGDEQDFQLLANALLAEPGSDPLQFTLTGIALGLSGDVTQRMVNGAASLLAASRRDDFPASLGDEVESLLEGAVSPAEFRRIALTDAELPAAAEFAHAAAAFRAAVDPARAELARDMLDQIGAIGEATSVSAAAAMITHASGVQDLPKLRLVAQSAGVRAAAAAKRLPRDGRLLTAARGELTMTRELFLAVTASGAALLGLLLILAWKAYQAGRSAWRRYYFEDDDYESELVDLSSSRNWRPL
ncbi:MAG: hypothetical protein R3C16_08615 [Hyphomonadaceae bacterium]